MSIDTNNSASTRTVVDWDDAPEGATHCVPTSAAKYWYKKIGDKFYAYNGTGWNTNHTSEKCVSMREIFEITRPKTITQAVFDGLPPEYRWAVVDNRGSAYAFNAKPKPFKSDFRDWDFHNVDTVSLGMDYDATDWQNSLIERQDVSSRVEQLRSVEEARQIESTLAERQNQYGDFSDVAHLSQGLQSLLSVGSFSDVQQEAMQMICSKLARLACGDADHVDSWHDIAGYATLVVKDLESGK